MRCWARPGWSIKTEGDLQARALRWSKGAVLLAAAGVAAISLATPFASSRHHATVVRLAALAVARRPLPLANGGRLRRHLALGDAGCSSGQSQREWLPFVLSVWVFVFAFAGLAYSLFPYLVVDRMTIWQAAAARDSLLFVFVGACFVLPLIVGYTVFAYRVFWGKARELSYGH